MQFSIPSKQFTNSSWSSSSSYEGSFSWNNDLYSEQGPSKAVLIDPLSSEIESSTKKNFNQRIALSTLEGIHMVDVNSIVRLQADNNYTTVYFQSEEPLIISKTLKEVEQKLDARKFIRVHQSHTIDISKIKMYRRGRGGNVILTNGDMVPISKVRKAILMEAIDLI